MTGIFQRLFGKRRISDISASESTEDIQTIQSSGEISAHSPGHISLFEPPQLMVGCGHSAGLQREHNEDAIFTLTTTLVSNSTHIPFGFYIIADGMGGHVHGELASEIAVRAMSTHVIRNLYIPLYNLSSSAPNQSIQEIMQEGVQIAHRAIQHESPGGGSTITAMLIMGGQITIAHVGDSRTYLIHSDGQIASLTRDHSLVQRMQELGQLSDEEAAVHPQRNVLYRALGQREPLEADVTSQRIISGYLLLCSDGLWGVVPEDEIVASVLNNTHPAQACQEMVAAANAAGGPDNISAILVQLPG
ncbi:MAG: serine/threonine-protein phosphatase [Anaerolineales bacterium]|nr:serine/threonine-protein phosphatase [Anaerolineales bacterium]